MVPRPPRATEPVTETVAVTGAGGYLGSRLLADAGASGSCDACVRKRGAVPAGRPSRSRSTCCPTAPSSLSAPRRRRPRSCTSPGTTRSWPPRSPTARSARRWSPRATSPKRPRGRRPADRLRLDRPRLRRRLVAGAAVDETSRPQPAVVVRDRPPGLPSTWSARPPPPASTSSCSASPTPSARPCDPAVDRWTPRRHRPLPPGGRRPASCVLRSAGHAVARLRRPSTTSAGSSSPPRPATGLPAGHLQPGVRAADDRAEPGRARAGPVRGRTPARGPPLVRPGPRRPDRRALPHRRRAPGRRSGFRRHTDRRRDRRADRLLPRHQRSEARDDEIDGLSGHARCAASPTSGARCSTCSARTATASSASARSTSRTVYPGAVKAWHLHREMTLNYAVPVGMVKLVCYDDRPDSPTQGQPRRAPHRRAQLRPRHDPAAGVERLQGRGHRARAGRQLLHHPAPPGRDRAPGPVQQRRSPTTGRCGMGEPVAEGGLRPHASTVVIDAEPDARRAWLSRPRGATARCSRCWPARTSRPATSGPRSACCGRSRCRCSRAWSWRSCSPRSSGSQGSEHYGAYVLAGMVAFSYFAVDADGRGHVDRRRRRPHRQGVVPAGPARRSCRAPPTSSAWRSRWSVLIVALPFLGVDVGPRLAAARPGRRAAASRSPPRCRSCVAALHVYFRDVKFLVQAALLVWIYVTPILYPKDAARRPRAVARPQPDDRDRAALPAGHGRGASRRWRRPVAIAVA